MYGCQVFVRGEKVLSLHMPAGTLASLKEAVNGGADAVYTSLSSATNARNLPGLNLSPEELCEGVAYAHERGREVYGACNVYPQLKLAEALSAADRMCECGVDAIIATDISVLDRVATRYSDVRRHLSVIAGIANARGLNFYRDRFGVSCAVLPRVVGVEDIREIRAETDVELEVFAFGVLCINCEGKCHLSAYFTGYPNNTYGCCSPTDFVSMTREQGRLSLRLGQRLLNVFNEGEVATYPTPCKGRYRDMEDGEEYYPFQSPNSLNVLELVPKLKEAGVDALKVEGRQRSHVYVRKVAAIYRAALDRIEEQGELPAREAEKWERELAALFEGRELTTACYGEK